MPNKYNLRPKPYGEFSIARYESLTLLALALLALCLGGACARHTHDLGRPTSTLVREDTAERVFLTILNTSDSGLDLLSQGTEEVARAPRFLGGDVWLTVVRFDYSPMEILSGPMPASGEEFLDEIVPKLAPRGGRDYTYIKPLFEFLTPRIKACKGLCVVLWVHDGHAEGSSAADHARVRVLAQELAQCAQLRAVFVEGVEPSQMASVRRDLGPLSSKLRFLSVGKIDYDLVNDLMTPGGER